MACPEHSGFFHGHRAQLTAAPIMTQVALTVGRRGGDGGVTRDVKPMIGRRKRRRKGTPAPLDAGGNISGDHHTYTHPL